MVATTRMADLGVLVSADVSIQNEDGERPTFSCNQVKVLAKPEDCEK